MNHTVTIGLRLLALLLLAHPAQAASLEVSNRAPRPGELGYRPLEGETARLNPPSFIWLHDTNAHTYTVQWARKADFSDAQTAAKLPFNTYTHDQVFAPGTYHWRYRFTTKDGGDSGWSATRKVIVPRAAAAFPMPHRAGQRARVPQGHPRLFLRPEDLPRLRELARGAEKQRFEELRREADRHIAKGPTPEPDKLGSARDKTNKELIKYWWPNREQAMRACQEAETIAFVYLITQEKKYGEAARQWILHLASWNPDGPTNFRLNCEAAKPMLYRPARAYDWAYDALTPADRAVFQKAMRRRAQDAWESWEVQQAVGHFTSPYGSHANRTWHKLGECAIALLGDVPEAETWLDYAVNKFHACYPVWADDDGGWHEGVSYLGGYMDKAVWWLQVAKSALNIDGFQKPFFAHVGDYPLYVAPPHSPNAGFGDNAYRTPSGWRFMEYFIRAQGNRPEGRNAGYWRWWTQQHQMPGEDGVLGFLYHANLPPLPAPKAPTDLPPSKVFQGIGVASLHHTLLDANDDVHLLFKSSPFGTQSHGHNAHNTFQLNAYGEALLPACVYRDLHGSKFHYEWAHSTRAQNGVLVNGEGQIKHTPAPHGRIVESKFTPQWDYVVGEATDAYGGRLTRYRRHIVFAKPELIVICDDLAAKEPATFQFLLHAPKAFTLDERSQSLSLALPKAGLTARYLSPAPVKLRQWDGYQPEPEFRDFPKQWHVEAGTTDKHKDLAMLTVMVPHRAGNAPKWAAERVESDTAIGVRFQRDGQTTLIALRKDGVKEATLAGVKFTEPVLVQGR
ncbi:MAG: DUF4962 domain-containing protein [Verrucomicrobiota bacterium]